MYNKPFSQPPTNQCPFCSVTGQSYQLLDRGELKLLLAHRGIHANGNGTALLRKALRESDMHGPHMHGPHMHGQFYPHVAK